jgi:hypothetical protein
MHACRRTTGQDSTDTVHAHARAGRMRARACGSMHAGGIVRHCLVHYTQACACARLQLALRAVLHKVQLVLQAAHVAQLVEQPAAAHTPVSNTCLVSTGPSQPASLACACPA